MTGDGLRAASARAAVVDRIILRLWETETALQVRLDKGIAITAVGGFGRGLLFPYSDVDILFCIDKSLGAVAKQPIRTLTQQLWDCGLQVSINTRTASDCERFDPGNPEFGISLLDIRSIGGDPDVFAKLQGKSIAKLRSRNTKLIAAELVRLTQKRHGKYGNTLFHLEPNIKECPGGLRDANVSEWLRYLRKQPTEGSDSEFQKALAFFAAVRCFLHYRHQRDDNTLDWIMQDEAAEQGIGLGVLANSPGRVDTAYWMRAYFRHARIVERCLTREVENSGLRIDTVPSVRRIKMPANLGFKIDDGRIELAPRTAGFDPARDPEIVLAAFAAMARVASRLSQECEERIGEAIPLLSANLEEGPGLWQQLSAILTGGHAGVALRSMHALGMLELILPEFHGIDALVIRDAYHRYTVDEHTFVLIDTLHDLEAKPAENAPEWRIKFGAMASELQNPALLYLAALLHDTGKGHSGKFHAVESVRMARGVLERLDMDPYDTALVLHLIERHLDMSAALRRDIFDAETVRAFATKTQTHEALRMLTLFTYADIAAVHPDALTPWKAENLWRLSMAVANHLDRNVDEDRFHAAGIASDMDATAIVTIETRDKLTRVLSLARGHEAAVHEFFEGFPERYVRTRTPEVMTQHFQMTRLFGDEPFQFAFQHGAVSEITLVTKDRPRLFTGMAAALTAWGMNVVTADAFANSAGVIVDTFRFTDTFRTLELNESERERFVVSVRELISGKTSVQKLLSTRRRVRRKAPRVVAETRIEFDDTASSHSTLVQVIAQDVPGLLRAVSETFSTLGYNLEVALIDTEGETAIDVFYITSSGNKLDAKQMQILRNSLLNAVSENASCA